MNSSQRGLHLWRKYLIRNLFLEKLDCHIYVMSLCLSNIGLYSNVNKKKFLFVWYSLLKRVPNDRYIIYSYEHMSRVSFITLWFVVYNFLNSAVSSLVVVSNQLIHKLTSGLLQICNTTNPTRKDLDNTKMKRFLSHV